MQSRSSDSFASAQCVGADALEGLPRLIALRREWCSFVLKVAQGSKGE